MRNPFDTTQNMFDSLANSLNDKHFDHAFDEEDMDLSQIPDYDESYDDEDDLEDWD